jgi:acetate kinase
MTHLLTINTGSSSLKAAVYDVGHGEAIVLVVQFERIGSPAHAAFCYQARKFLIARHTYRIISHTGASRVSV